MSAALNAMYNLWGPRWGDVEALPACLSAVRPSIRPSVQTLLCQQFQASVSVTGQCFCLWPHAGAPGAAWVCVRMCVRKNSYFRASVLRSFFSRLPPRLAIAGSFNDHVFSGQLAASSAGMAHFVDRTRPRCAMRREARAGGRAQIATANP